MSSVTTHGRAVALAVLLQALALAAPARAAIPTMSVPAGPIPATEEFHWAVPIRITNPTGGGIHLDSMFLDLEVLDEGESRVPRRSTLPLPHMVRLIESIAAMDADEMSFQGQALAERAKLTFRLWVHGPETPSTMLSATTEVAPGPRSLEHPSEFLVTPSKRKVEVVFLPASRPNAPGLLMVHGHANHARMMLRGGLMLADSGYAVMLVSQPGYGRSEGPADLMGPSTIEAVETAFDDLARRPGVDKTRLAAWGMSRGATAVAALAARRADLDAIVTQGGAYDLWATWRGTDIEGFPEIVVAEAGRDSAAWRARSPIFDAARIRAAVLVVHGEKDSNVPAGQAHAFVAALREAGVAVEEKFFPNGAHLLPRGEVTRAALNFLRRRLGS